MGTSIIEHPWIMTRDSVKTILQLSVSTYDTLIDYYLPLVTEDIDIITNCLWVLETTGTLTVSSTEISSITVEDIKKGMLVSTVQYLNSAITEYNEDGKILTVSDNGTSTVEGATILINTFPRSKTITVAQMVAFQIAKNNGVSSVSEAGVKSKSMGTLSVSYSDIDNSLSNGYGYPAYMIQSLKTVTQPRYL